MGSGSKLKLYSYYRSSCSYRVRIALNLKQLDYEYVPIHLVKAGGEQYSSIYKLQNPKMEVPCLVHGDKVLNQSMAIISYLDKCFPKPSLFPAEHFDAAKVLEICEIINSGIQPIQNLSVMKFIQTNYALPDEAKSKWAFHWITSGFNALEAALKMTHGKFCFGNSVTAADLFLVPQVYNAYRFEVDMNGFPIIERAYKNAIQIEAFKLAEPGVQPDAV